MNPVEVPKYPVVRPETRAEVETIEGLLYEFILKAQESARELDQMALVLDNYLNICRAVRDSLLGLADCETQSIPPQTINN